MSHTPPTSFLDFDRRDHDEMAVVNARQDGDTCAKVGDDAIPPNIVPVDLRYPLIS
jgi:hypothetical protein